MKKGIALMMALCLLLPVCQAKGAAEPKIAEFSTEAEFTQSLYENLCARQTAFCLAYTGDLDDFYDADLKDLFDTVWETDLNGSDDFDYLRYNVRSYEVDNRLEQGGAFFTVRVDYMETASELAQVNKKAKRLLDKLGIASAADAVKVRKIHDALIFNASYEQAAGAGSAYAALGKKQASGRGYALAFYKLLTDAGVPCRIVSGKARGMAHYWNIVCLDGRWYHVDTALDDGGSAVLPVRYDDFLIGTDTLALRHTLAESFDMADFEMDHPMSKADYPKRNALILQADADRIKAKSGVGWFNEGYSVLSDSVVDPLEKFNDALCSGALDALEGVFSGS